MTAIIPPKIFPSPLPSEQFAQTGDTPSPTALRRVAQTYNTVSSSHKRVLFTKTYDPSNTPAPASSSEAPLQFIFRTTENVSEIAMLVGLAPASQTSGTSPASVQLNINDGTLYAYDNLYQPKVQSGAYTPEDVVWIWTSTTTGMSPATSYQAYIVQNHYARIHSVTVYELAKSVADSSDVGVTDPSLFEQGRPILDSDIQSLAETGTKLWQHNGPMLFAWSRHTVATKIRVTSTTYVNLFDASVSTVTSSSPGFILNTQYHDTQKGDVPVEIGIIAVLIAGSGNASIKFVDAAGTVIEDTGITTAATSPPYTYTGTITAKASTKTDIHVKVPSGGTWDFYAVALWEYEA